MFGAVVTSAAALLEQRWSRNKCQLVPAPTWTPSTRGGVEGANLARPALSATKESLLDSPTTNTSRRLEIHGPYGLAIFNQA